MGRHIVGVNRVNVYCYDLVLILANMGLGQQPRRRKRRGQDAPQATVLHELPVQGSCAVAPSEVNLLDEDDVIAVFLAALAVGSPPTPVCIADEEDEATGGTDFDEYEYENEYFGAADSAPHGLSSKDMALQTPITVSPVLTVVLQGQVEGASPGGGGLDPEGGELQCGGCLLGAGRTEMPCIKSVSNCECDEMPLNVHQLKCEDDGCIKGLPDVDSGEAPPEGQLLGIVGGQVQGDETLLDVESDYMRHDERLLVSEGGETQREKRLYDMEVPDVPRDKHIFGVEPGEMVGNERYLDIVCGESRCGQRPFAIEGGKSPRLTWSAEPPSHVAACGGSTGSLSLAMRVAAQITEQRLESKSEAVKGMAQTLRSALQARERASTRFGSLLCSGSCMEGK